MVKFDLHSSLGFGVFSIPGSAAATRLNNFINENEKS
jgi:hypothetical protein